MINILIEGTGSERVFWNQLLSLVDRSKFRLIPYGGIRNLITVYSNNYNEQDKPLMARFVKNGWMKIVC